MSHHEQQAVHAATDSLATSLADGVDLFLSNHVLWLVPLVLILMQFIFKLFLGRRASESQIWEQILRSPIEIGFLAISFMASLVLKDVGNLGSRFPAVLLFVVLLAISTLISRFSPTGLSLVPRLKAIGLTLLNFLINLGMLIYSISRLKGSGV